MQQLGEEYDEMARVDSSSVEEEEDHFFFFDKKPKLCSFEDSLLLGDFCSFRDSPLRTDFQAHLHQQADHSSSTSSTPTGGNPCLLGGAINPPFPHHHHVVDRDPSLLVALSSFYDSSFCKIPLCDDVRSAADQTPGLTDEPSDSDCYSSCPPSLVPSCNRADPSLDPQFFEFGTIHIPVSLQHGNGALLDVFKSCNRLSLELFAYHLGDSKSILQTKVVELTEDGSHTCGYQQKSLTHSYKTLIDELILNEAQGQLQVIVTPSPELHFNLEGTINIRVFLKRQRDDEVLVLKELLKELFPQDSELRSYLQQVEEMKAWSEKTDDWTTFSGLLSDLESNGYDEAPHPIGLSVPLRSYQLQSLQFMLDAEKREGGLLSINYHKIPSAPVLSEPLMYSATLGHLMTFRRGSSCGGFLCEEMGLGKTIEILALILSNPCPLERATAPGCSRGTLVVCPVSIVGQWANEVKSKLAANLSIYMYHGSKRIRDPKKLSKFDIVITTYATLGSDFSKATQATRHGSGFAEQFCPLLSVNWWRVVLDESHTVKDPAPLHSRACTRLKAERRWCCTGTPINTSIYDLYGQFLFLKLEPLDNKDIFRRRIGRPYERHCKNEDQTVLLWTLNKMMIRHTKQQKLNGRELLRLPPKSEQDIIVTFSPEERNAYDAVYHKVLAKFEQFRSWGPTIVSKNILQIMSLLLPLRRLCSGGFISTLELNAMDYVKRDSHITPAFDSCPENGRTRGREEEHVEGECGMCFEIMECPTRTPCNHWFCLECVMSVLGSGSQTCPTCRSFLLTEQLETIENPSGFTLIDSDISAASSPLSGNGVENGRAVAGVHMDSKLKTLLADLARVREENAGAKVLIFSQFTQTIAWLKNEFKNQGITYRFISGDMPMKKRAQAIEAFQKDPPTTVFLLSIRTGAVGLTLTAASHVYMLEPCLNPALEEQAVGRCWRMGQERPVVIKRLYVENSVEANILKLLKSRRASHLKLSSSTPDNSEPSARIKTGKSSVTDVAGCIRSDKQNLRLSEFEILFS
ncbi:hypothetical protein L7F22_010268 [Adiantum nelumboides]|nr:hypothetical protein [Adiantum nelumboides]